MRSNSMKSNSFFLPIFGILLFLLGIGSWIANLFKLIFAADGGMNAKFILRIVGVFVAPLGSILGFF